MDCLVSIERVRQLLLAEEFDESMKAKSEPYQRHSTACIDAQDVAVAWPTEDGSQGEPDLRGLTLRGSVRGILHVRLRRLCRHVARR